jgi:PPOX class probable F420-dependent enzyme
MTTLDANLLALLHTQRNGILATIRRDGRPQLSTVSYTFDDNVIRASITDDRAKTKNLRRDPRAVFYVTKPDFSGYVAVDAQAELSAVATDPHDDATEQLVEVYRAIAGEHPDWDEYRAAMIEQKRLVVRLTPSHVYGWAGQS